MAWRQVRRPQAWGYGRMGLGNGRWDGCVGEIAGATGLRAYDPLFWLFGFLAGSIRFGLGFVRKIPRNRSVISCLRRRLAA